MKENFNKTYKFLDKKGLKIDGEIISDDFYSFNIQDKNKIYKVIIKEKYLNIDENVFSFSVENYLGSIHKKIMFFLKNGEKTKAEKKENSKKKELKNKFNKKFAEEVAIIDANFSMSAPKIINLINIAEKKDNFKDISLLLLSLN